MPQAAGQVKILIFLVKIKFPPYIPKYFVMQQGKCLFSDAIKLRKDLIMDLWPKHNLETEKASEDQEDSTAPTTLRRRMRRREEE